MTFPNDIDLHTAYQDDASAAQDKLSAATLDADHLELERWINDELLPALAQIMRDDGTLPDYLVRYRNLHPEVFADLTAAVGSVPLAVPGDGTVSTTKLALLAVTTAILADGAVTTAKLADGAVTTAKMAAGGLGTAALADLAVTAAKIAAETITNAQIAAGAAIAWSKISKVGADPTDIGAATAIHGHSADNITSGTMNQDRLGSGSGGAGTRVLYDDQTWKIPGGGSSGWETGDIRPYTRLGAAPAGWLDCDGAAVSRATYSTLFAALCPTEVVAQATDINIGTDTISTPAATIAETGVPVRLSSDGAMPTGLSNSTTYYAIKAASSSIKVASSLANALAGTAVDITAVGSGNLTIRYHPFGIGDGSTTFNVPDTRRRTLVGNGGSASSTLAACVGATGGAETHTLTVSEIPSHTHSAIKAGAYVGTGFGGGNTQGQPANSVGGDGAHNNLQPSLVVRYIIKT